MPRIYIKINISALTTDSAVNFIYAEFKNLIISKFQNTKDY